MTRRYDLVVFDLDGTLVDSASAVSETMRAALVGCGLPAASAAAIEALIGLNLRVMAERVSPVGTADPVIDAVVVGYRDRYPAIAHRIEQPFPRVREMLEAVGHTGATLAVATGKSQRGADDAVARHGLATHFETVLGSDSVPRGKPHPDLLHHLLRQSGVAPERTLMIGDTTFDLHMGTAAGVDTCAVTWGTHTVETLQAARPTWVVSEMEALQSIVGVFQS